MFIDYKWNEYLNNERFNYERDNKNFYDSVNHEVKLLNTNDKTIEECEMITYLQGWKHTPYSAYVSVCEEVDCEPISRAFLLEHQNDFTIRQLMIEDIAEIVLNKKRHLFCERIIEYDNTTSLLVELIDTETGEMLCNASDLTHVDITCNSTLAQAKQFGAKVIKAYEKREEMRMSILNFIEEHQTAWEDFKTYFNIEEQENGDCDLSGIPYWKIVSWLVKHQLLAFDFLYTLL